MAGYNPLGPLGPFGPICGTAATQPAATTTTGNVAISANTVWQRAISATSANAVWQSWNEIHQQALEAAMQAHLQQQLQDRARRLTAAEQARNLLLSCLDAEQRERWEKHKQFIVRCPSGRRYILSNGEPPMALDDDANTIISYCIHTTGIPREDELLGFKLMLEANETLFLEIANATWLPRPQRIAA